MLNRTLEEIALAADRLAFSWSYPAGVENAEFLYLHGVGGKRYLVNKTKSPFLSSVQGKLVTDKFLSGQVMAAAGLPVAPKMMCEVGSFMPTGSSALVSESTNPVKSSIGYLNSEFLIANSKNLEILKSAESFLRQHKEIIVKPNRMDRGVGVTDRISSVPELQSALEKVATYGASAILEKQITGREYRILVINGKAVAALERKPLVVIGDGRSTIHELILQMNLDPRRGSVKDRKQLRRIALGSEFELNLKRIGLDLNSVLEKDQPKQLSFSNHLDSGGIAADCTDIAARENLKICENAATLLGIDVAGIDLICQDITRPIAVSDNAAILEVNPGPDILWHMYPAEGSAQPVADEFVKYVCGGEAVKTV